MLYLLNLSYWTTGRPIVINIYLFELCVKQKLYRILFIFITICRMTPPHIEERCNIDTSDISDGEMITLSIVAELLTIDSENVSSINQ